MGLKKKESPETAHVVIVTRACPQIFLIVIDDQTILRDATDKYMKDHLCMGTIPLHGHVVKVKMEQ